ncbi:MAG: hypothetical protein F4025_01050, partial [Synechococcus sp. SB0669_bin_7]|nr:hypothetical protein [Synechococcus sp. SB0669_bin_7]
MGNHRKRALLLGLALPLLSTPASYGQGLLDLLDQVAYGEATMVESQGAAQGVAQIPSLPTSSTGPEDPATASPGPRPVESHRVEPRLAHPPWLSPPPPLAAL